MRIYDKRVEVCEQLWRKYEQRRHVLSIQHNTHRDKQQFRESYYICVFWCLCVSLVRRYACGKYAYINTL